MFSPISRILLAIQVFDGALRQGLEAQLEQSPFLNLLSESQIQQTLRMMEQPDDARLTPERAQEICRRAGGAAVLEGSVVQIGTQYSLTLKALNCSSGELLASAEAQAGDKNHVLEALGKLASAMRTRLGESLGTAQKFDTPVEQATTPSLEALQAFSLGRRTMDDYKAAIPFFQRAVDLDPNFAIAYATLGICYFALGETSLGAQNTRKAYELRQQVSEREKLYIESHYDEVVTGDLEKATQVYELWAELYPRDLLPRNNLGDVYRYLGQHDRALTNLRDSFLLGNTNYANLVLTYLNLNRFRDARAASEEAHARNLDSPSLHFHLYLLGFLQSDEANMARQVAWSAGRPGFEDVLLAAEADTAAYSGRLGRAREFSRRAEASAEQVAQKEVAGAFEVEAALREAVFGNAAQARQRAQSALALSRGRDVQAGAALALAMAGDRAQAEILLDDLTKRFPEDTYVQYNWLPTAHAVLALNRNDSAKAIEALEATTLYELGAHYTGAFPPAMYPVYMRGQACLAARRGGDAALEFQKILDHSGIVLNEPIGALAHLGLARAYALEAGISGTAAPAVRNPSRPGTGEAPVPPPEALAKARAAYQDFFTLWKDADPDIPILKQAKAEYTKLQ